MSAQKTGYGRRVVDSGRAEHLKWNDMAWVESTPLGERFIFAMAPRGVLLRRDPSGGDVGDLLWGIVEFIVGLVRDDGTWKVGVSNTKKVRRSLFKRTGLRQREAEREVERLLSCVRRGDLSWN